MMFLWLSISGKALYKQSTYHYNTPTSVVVGMLKKMTNIGLIYHQLLEQTHWCKSQLLVQDCVEGDLQHISTNSSVIEGLSELSFGTKFDELVQK